MFTESVNLPLATAEDSWHWYGPHNGVPYVTIASGVHCITPGYTTSLFISPAGKALAWHRLYPCAPMVSNYCEFVQSRRASKVIQPCHGYATPLCSHFSAVCPLLLQPTLCLEVLTENCKPVSPVWTLLHIQAKLYCQVWFPWQSYRASSKPPMNKG